MLSSVTLVAQREPRAPRGGAVSHVDRTVKVAPLLSCQLNGPEATEKVEPSSVRRSESLQQSFKILFFLNRTPTQQQQQQQRPAAGE